MKQKLIDGRAHGMLDAMIQIGLAIMQEEKKKTCPECGNEHLISRCNCKKGENE